jgi:inner membrane protein
MKTEKTLYGLTQTISFKLVLVGFLSLILLIPTAWIRLIISERESRNEEVNKEISSIWGGKQNLAGPVLSIPYKKKSPPEAKNDVEKTGVAYFLPEHLEIDATINPTKRHRGIFKVVVYNADIRIRGNFFHPDPAELGLSEDELDTANAALLLGVPDMRGIQKDVSFTLNEKSLRVTPGSLYRGIIPSGFHVKSIDGKSILQGESSFSIDLSLNGSNSLGFYPLGKKTSVKVSSTWPDPSFEGSFLPVNSDISESGFTANWTITHLNRNFPQAWIDDGYSFEDSCFGTGLFLPVNHYQKSERSLKYAIMFIALTFLLFLLIEILNRKKLHPVQYFLVGMAISVFYILLVSLSEHMNFTIAFLISSFAVISLITFYTHSNYQSRSLTLITFFVLSFLYVFLFVILQSQDYSLLIGSIGLFIVLGTFMYLTRRINWYKQESGEDS